MSKRLLALEKMTSLGSKDPFAWYGLAMEYKGLGRPDESLATFVKLRALDAKYLPQYLMCGNLLVEMSRADEAREWLRAGIEVAREKGDGHALAELEGALAAV